MLPLAFYTAASRQVLQKEVEVYYRLCLSGKCVREWNRWDQYIFRLSKYVCMGWEMGWRFTEDLRNLIIFYINVVELVSLVECIHRI